MFTLFLYFQLVVGNLYGGGLASVMTVTRYEDPINNVQRLVDSGLLWGGASADFTFSILHTKNPTLRRFIDQYSVFPMAKCAELGKEQKMALVAEQLQYGKFSHDGGKFELLQMCITRPLCTWGPLKSHTISISCFPLKSHHFTKKVPLFGGK